MEFVIPWPVSTGGWLAFISAVIAALLGLLETISPLFRRGRSLHPQILAGMGGGFGVGLGLSAILLDQPLLYLALGASWALAAFACLIFLLASREKPAWMWILPAFQIVFALMPLAYVFGHVP